MSISNQQYINCLSLLDSLENTIQTRSWITPISSLNKALFEVEITFRRLLWSAESPDDTQLKALEDKITKIGNLLKEAEKKHTTTIHE